MPRCPSPWVGCDGRLGHPTQCGGDETSLQQNLFLQRSKTLPVRFRLFRWMCAFCSTFFSTDNLAKSDFPGEIPSHGKLSPCPSWRRCKGLCCGSASHMPICPWCFPQPVIFKASLPNSCRGRALCAVGQEPSWGQGMPCGSPSALHPLLHAAKILGFFPQPRVRIRLGGSCCSRECRQQEPCWLLRAEVICRGEQ